MSKELGNCKFCGSKVRIIEPDDEANRIIFCDNCTVVFCLATLSTAEELIEAYERNPK